MIGETLKTDCKYDDYKTFSSIGRPIAYAFQQFDVFKNNKLFKKDFLLRYVIIFFPNSASLWTSFVASLHINFCRAIKREMQLNVR